MASTDQNITADKATRCTLGIQFSDSDLLFCIRSGNEILQMDGERFDFRQSVAENLRRIIERHGLGLPFQRICILPVSDKACLTPAELAEADSASAFLRANGITVAENERAFYTGPVKSIAAAISLPDDVLGVFETLYGGSVCYRHPLQVAIAKNHTHPTVEINTSNHLLTIALTNTKPEYCEIISYSDPVEILFLLQQLDKEYDLRDYDILISGEQTPEILKQVKPYYRNVSTPRAEDIRIPKRLRGELPNFINLICCTDADH